MIFICICTLGIPPIVIFPEGTTSNGKYLSMN